MFFLWVLIYYLRMYDCIILVYIYGKIYDFGKKKKKYKNIIVSCNVSFWYVMYVIFNKVCIWNNVLKYVDRDSIGNVF